MLAENHWFLLQPWFGWCHQFFTLLQLRLNIRGFCFWLGEKTAINRSQAHHSEGRQGAPSGGHWDKVNWTWTCNHAPKAMVSDPCSLWAVCGSPSFLNRDWLCVSATQDNKGLVNQVTQKKRSCKSSAVNKHIHHTLSHPTTPHKFQGRRRPAGLIQGLR